MEATVHAHIKNMMRNVEFWKRAGKIYASYKFFQLTQRFAPLNKTSIISNGDSVDEAEDNDNAFSSKKKGSDQLHEINSQRMVDLCLSLRGFYLKSGQFLGTRHDFMPPQYTSKLSRLQDQVPALGVEETKKIIEEELRGPVGEYFTSLNLSHPIGSASIAQVHSGIWKRSGQKVAVKVQNPEAEVFMKSDLQNLCQLAEFLQRTELKFDILSALKELRNQISNEFDFNREAKNMDLIGSKLRPILSNIVIPQSIQSTKRLLVMTFIEGDNLSRLAALNQHNAISKLPRHIKQKIGSKLLRSIVKAWGEQIFVLRIFHGDPHPGNICITPSGRIGLMDWGQVKVLPEELCKKYAKMVLALHSRQQAAIVQSFRGLGVIVSNPADVQAIERIALTMFDTIAGKHYVLNPFSSKSAIKRNSVLSMPPDLYFIVRAVQLMRGISCAFALEDFSVANIWTPYARQVLYPSKQ
jgi:predicted unusual protein kinase regulating ubiquinone biosynthesis (AarF/ABC1/UbiB family)